MTATDQLVFAMTGAYGLCGGIATANLNVLRALVEVARERGCVLRVLSLFEQPADRPPFLPNSAPFRAFAGSKHQFAAGLLKRAGLRTLLCFDHVTLAWPVLPLAACGLARTVIFAHGSEAWKRLRWSSRQSFRFARLCLTNSHYTLRQMCSQMDRFNGVACPLGLSSEMSLNLNVPASMDEPLLLTACDGQLRPLGDRVLLLVARMHPQEREKGHLPLLRVLPQLLERFPKVQLVFPGPGDDITYLTEQARSVGVGGSVFIPGKVPGDLLHALYRLCYALVMPSRQEGFGLVYLEAMNCAKPCVGCFADGAEDVIVHGETGYLVHDPADRDELKQVLMRLLDDSAAAGGMGRKGFERLHERFTARHYQERVRQEILTVL